MPVIFSCFVKWDSKAGLRPSTYTTKFANWPITDAPEDIVVSLSSSFQLDFVVHDAPDGFRRCYIRFKKWIGYNASWQSERTHDAQLIVWAVLADGIGNRKPFAGFLLGAPTTQRSVNKLLACFIQAFLSFLLHVSSYSALIPSLIAPFDVQKRIASFRFASDNTLVYG